MKVYKFKIMNQLSGCRSHVNGKVGNIYRSRQMAAEK